VEPFSDVLRGRNAFPVRKRARGGVGAIPRGDSSASDSEASAGLGGERAASGDGDSSGGDSSGADSTGTDSEAAGSDAEGAQAAQNSDEDGAAPLARIPRARKPKLQPYDRHVLLPMSTCIFGCGAMVFPDEGSVCCSSGKHILGPNFNPPIDQAYRTILQMEHMAADSRFLNDAVAMGSQGVFPTKALGGLGFVHNHYGFVFLMGRAYCVMRPLSGNNAFDNHLLPDNLLVDGATNDLGKDYAERLLRVRTYLAQRHPLAQRLKAIADVPGERFDLNPYLRIESNVRDVGRMELAFVSSGVAAGGDAPNKVLYFDMRRHDQGLAPVTVSRRSALYDLLMFPLVHETGAGGFFYPRDGSSVQSTKDVRLSLQHYARAMLFQNERLHYLGRLAQEYAPMLDSNASHAATNMGSMMNMTLKKFGRYTGLRFVKKDECLRLFSLNEETLDHLQALVVRQRFVNNLGWVPEKVSTADVQGYFECLNNKYQASAEFQASAEASAEGDIKASAEASAAASAEASAAASAEGEFELEEDAAMAAINSSAAAAAGDGTVTVIGSNPHTTPDWPTTMNIASGREPLNKDFATPIHPNSESIRGKGVSPKTMLYSKGGFPGGEPREVAVICGGCSKPMSPVYEKPTGGKGAFKYCWRETMGQPPPTCVGMMKEEVYNHLIENFDTVLEQSKALNKSTKPRAPPVMKTSGRK
jgi:hypothetical protein